MSSIFGGFCLFYPFINFFIKTKRIKTGLIMILPLIYVSDIFSDSFAIIYTHIYYYCTIFSRFV